MRKDSLLWDLQALYSDLKEGCLSDQQQRGYAKTVQKVIDKIEAENWIADAMQKGES